MYRKPFRRYFILLVSLFPLLSAGIVLDVLGIRTYTGAAALQDELHRHQLSGHTHLTRIALLVDFYEPSLEEQQADAVFFAARESAEELERHVAGMEEVLTALHRPRWAEASRHGMRDLAALFERVVDVDALDLDDFVGALRAEADLLRMHLTETTSRADALLDDDLRLGLTLAKLGSALEGVCALLALVVMLFVFLDVMNAAGGPPDIQALLARIASGDELRPRLRLLRAARGADPPAAEGGGWDLALEEILVEDDTHIAFTALARRKGAEGEEVQRLVGKYYRLAGRVKRFQRLIFPSYARASWSALCRIHRHLPEAPTPVLFTRIKDGGVPAGHVVLVEHIGEVESLKRYVRAKLELLEPAQRRGFVEALGTFLARLNELGVFGVKPPHVHVKQPDGDVPQLHYLDADSAVVLPRAPRLLRRLFAWRLRRRFTSVLRDHVREEELAAFLRALGRV